MPPNIAYLKALPRLASLWLIARSRIFDPNWYKLEYPQAQGMNPLVHYALEGARQGARPHLLFDPAWYRRGRGGKLEDPDPLLDYVKFGAAQGVDPSPYFSASYYRQGAGDLAGLTPLGHFIAFGVARGISPTPFFDREWYLANNPDVRRAGFDPFLHFVASGARDGRSPGPLFDASWYRLKNVDARECEPLAHYLGKGAVEGRSPCENFDPAFYVSGDPGCSTTMAGALVDYAEHGRQRWRSTHRILPPPTSSAACFEDLPWRLAESPAIEAPFRVLIVDIGGRTPSRRSVELLASLSSLPQLAAHLVTDAPDFVAPPNIAALNLARPELASLDRAAAVERLIRALKFRDHRALVIEANCAVTPLDRLCAELDLAYHRFEPAEPQSAAGWMSLLERRIFYRPSPRPSISVIVPNYNHARYLDERLASIAAQRLPPAEIIFLDDASTDDSVLIAESWQARSSIPFAIVRNETNSGSPFRQWAKGVSRAAGELIWIAESDDTADRRFLERVCEGFFDPEVVMAYSDSATIGTEGQTHSRSYRFYTDTLDETKWRSGYVESGAREIATALAVKNTIPNVSAALFRRTTLEVAVEPIGAYRYCGDWLAYVECLRRGKISFCPQALNRHRQDPLSVTPQGERAVLSVREAISIKRSIFADPAVSDDVIWRSLAQTVFEYELRSLPPAPPRPAFADNEDLAASIRDMTNIIAHRPLDCAGEDGASAFLRALADASVTLDSDGRQTVVARSLSALRAIAGKA